ncbi:hypothetical protein BH23PAT1_BH23PAT1_1290 [soil metagenome]
MVEPLPVKEMEVKDPGLYEQLMKIPTFVLWALRQE